VQQQHELSHWTNTAIQYNPLMDTQHGVDSCVHWTRGREGGREKGVFEPLFESLKRFQQINPGV